MKKRGKKAQFYLVAAIIIAGILISISYLANYSIKTISYDGEEMAQELRMEGERVLDYELNNPLTGIEEFEDFSAEYSYYARDKDIYFILVDVKNGIQEAYMYNEEIKINLDYKLNVGSDEIQFNLDSKPYTFPLEEGKNFYFIIFYEKRGETYVYTS